MSYSSQATNEQWTSYSTTQHVHTEKGRLLSTHNRHDKQTEITYKFELSFLLLSFMFLEKILASRQLFVHLTTLITSQQQTQINMPFTHRRVETLLRMYLETFHPVTSMACFATVYKVPCCQAVYKVTCCRAAYKVKYLTVRLRIKYLTLLSGCV